MGKKREKEGRDKNPERSGARRYIQHPPRLPFDLARLDDIFRQKPLIQTGRQIPLQQSNSH